MISAVDALENAKTIVGKNGLNCIAGLIDDAALEAITTQSASDGILAGVPILVKDNIDVAGFSTIAGSLA